MIICKTIGVIFIFILEMGILLAYCVFENRTNQIKAIICLYVDLLSIHSFLLLCMYYYFFLLSSFMHHYHFVHSHTFEWLLL